jgi:phosphomannomutase
VSEVTATAGSALDAARLWLVDDPDVRMRDELASLIAAAEGGDADAQVELEDAFSGTLEFGTAGLRGRIGPGPNRMNLVVVARAAAGLAGYLNERGGGAVVIGYDARIDSDLFANATAQILTGAGISAMVLPERLPTPLLAYAVRHLGCAAGVMVTASHNPPEDNGYKVYLGDGCQIVPPADHDISAHIAGATALGRVADLPHGDQWVTLGDDVRDDYVRTIAALVDDDSPRHVTVAYTAMHGVGGAVFLQVIEQAGFPEPVVVADQFEPDAAFPTVTFPNPEEPGAIDLAIATARIHGVDVVIAHDPDADRCAVAAEAPDGWRMLTGDETGALLAWWIVERIQRRDAEPSGVFAQSLVSGSLLERIAMSADLAYEQTLTGFKWIARVPGLLFGYEEALGYCVAPDVVRDKDGISAGLLVIELVATLKAQGRTLFDVLDRLAREHGVHATRQVSVRVSDLDRIGAVMSALRSAPPTEVAGVPVVHVDDLAQPTDGLPPTDGLRFTLVDDSRIVVRPSGTEPKVKCYLQAVVPVGDDLLAAREEAERRLQAMSVDVGRWLQ